MFNEQTNLLHQPIHEVLIQDNTGDNLPCHGTPHTAMSACFIGFTLMRFGLMG